MAISFDKALGIHQQALSVRVDRAELIANNLANADTPGFKARDIDFQSALADATKMQAGDALSINTTHQGHFDHMDESDSMPLLYRTPQQPSLDGNTVETDIEMAQFMQNAMDYEASFQFLNSKFKGLMNAIRGE